METKTLERLWTIAEAAKYLNVSNITLFRYLSLGKAKRTKVGGRTLIREGELLKLIEDGAPARKLRRAASAVVTASDAKV
jgi:excisionase family DNA binding protein